MIKKILVPVDFTESSLNALEYAMQYAEATHMHCEVIHALTPMVDINDPGAVTFDALRETKEKQLLDCVAKYKLKDGSKPNGVLHIGFPADIIVEQSTRNDVHMIIMGTGGEHNVLKKVFGSVSVYAMNHAHCPVMLVPPDVHFSGIRKIQFASNYVDEDIEILSPLIDLGSTFHSHIYFTHVTGSGKGGDVSKKLKLDNIFAGSKYHVGMDLITLEGVDIAEELKTYAQKEKIDLLAVAREHKTIFRELMQKSVSKKLTYDLKVPLLIMHYGEKKVLHS